MSSELIKARAKIAGVSRYLKQGKLLPGLACIKGGLVAVPTATTMTLRELQFRFESYPPDAILCDAKFTNLMDEAIRATGVKPKIKIVLGVQTHAQKGWTGYADLDREAETAEAARTKSQDLLFCFFTSGTTGLPKKVGHTAVSYPVGHLSTTLLTGIRPDDVHHNLSAPGWAKWSWSSFFAPFNVGATATGFNFTVLDGKKYLEAVAAHKISVFCAPPTAWRMFINLDISKYDLSFLRQTPVERLIAASALDFLPPGVEPPGLLKNVKKFSNFA